MVCKNYIRLKKFIRNPKHYSDLIIFRIFKKHNLISINQDTQISIYNEVIEVAKNYNVNNIILNDEYIWPYIRNHMWVHLNFVAIGKSGIHPNAMALYGGHYSQFTKEYRAEAIRQPNINEINDLPHETNDFLFFFNINGTEELEHHNKIYHRITDPLYEAAQQLGSAKKIAIIKNGLRDVSHKPYYHEAQFILPPQIYSTGYGRDIKIQTDFFNKRAIHSPSFSLTGKIFRTLIDHAMFTREYYLDLLKRLSPKVICLYGFHYQAPLISAADELGILTVDLQHGLQVGWNPLYNNYDELPLSGYPSLPDYFAVWGKKEYDNILQTFKSDKHKPIYMGSPWLKKIDAFSKPLPDHLINHISQFKTRILIIMQNQMSIPELFLNIIKKSSDDILWIIRHHPKGERYQSKDFSKTKNILVDDEIDNVLFNELFKYTDIAISEGSALAIEASFFGVQNIITSKMGAENYKYEIDNDIFYYLDDDQEFNNILKKIKSRPKNDSYGFKDIEPQEFLKSLLMASENKRKLHIKNNSKKVESKILDMLKYKENISKLVDDMYQYLEQNDIGNAIDLFLTIRKTLPVIPMVKELYNNEQDIWMKEAKIYQRNMNNSFNDKKIDVVLIGDSLELPRPLETKLPSFGIEKTVSYILNKNKYKTKTWAQRFLTTEKLLNNWSLMTGDLENKHLIIHLGLNDSAPRIFLEDQRLSIPEHYKDVQNKIVQFGQNHRRDIILKQEEHSYVSYKTFIQNIEEIAKRASNVSVKSLTFINIINFPMAHELDTPGSKEITDQYNMALQSLEKKYNFINLIDLDKTIHNDGFERYMLADNMHLSYEGHKLLADCIMSTLINIE